MKLRFDDFGSSTLVAHAASFGQRPSDVLVTAARHWLSESERQRYTARVPRFARTRGDDGHRAREHELFCELPRGDAEALSTEAAQQGVSLSCLLEHAALLYLADVDAARVGASALSARPR